MTDEIQTLTNRRFSRRSVVRTAAWSAPVITVITAAPAFAYGSQTPVLSVGFNGASYANNTISSNVPANETSTAEGMAGNGPYMWLALDLAVTNAADAKPFTNFLITVAAAGSSANGVYLRQPSSKETRSGVSWPTGLLASLESLWTISPNPEPQSGNHSATKEKQWTFTSNSPTTVGTSLTQFLLILANTTSADAPITLDVVGSYDGGSVGSHVSVTFVDLATDPSGLTSSVTSL
jgi:hypothetical protein